MPEHTPTVSAEVGRAILEDGYAILPNAIEPDLADQLTRHIDRILVELEIPRGTNNFLGKQTRRIFNLLARDPLFQRIPSHPALLGVIECVLGDQCLLSSLTAIEMGPGETAQPIHADDGSYDLPKPHPAYNCTALLALTDFTADNGGTRIVKGSHLRDRGPQRGDRDETMSIEMRAGSVLFYHGSLWHGGGSNQTSERRLGIVSNYCAGFLRQEECQLLALPRDVVATFPERLLKLVGYGTYNGLLGHVDQQDPGALVDPGIETDMVWRRIRS